MANSASITFSLPFGHQNSFRELAKKCGMTRSALLADIIEALAKGHCTFIPRTPSNGPDIIGNVPFGDGHGLAQSAPQQPASRYRGFGPAGYPRHADGSVDFERMSAPQMKEYNDEHGASELPLPADNWFAKRVAAGNVPQAIKDEFSSGEGDQ